MSRKTDLLTAMSGVRPDELDPPADPGRLERFRAVAAASEARADRPTQKPRPGVRFPRPARYSVAAATAALVAGLVAVTHPADHEPAPPSARRTLLAAATALETAGGTGRYWTADLSTRTIVGHVGDPPAANPLYRYTSTCDARLWASKSSRDASWLVIDSVTDRRLSGADERAWRRSGAPGARGCQIYHTSIGMRSAPPAALGLERSVPAGSREAPTYPSIAGVPVTLDQIAGLPTDPAALKAALDKVWTQAGGRADQGVPTAVTVQEIADLLVSAPVPPAMQAALYRVLADLPISRSRGTVTDRLGRRGVAFWADTGALDEKLIVDPRTGHPLAVEGYLHGHLDSYTLVRRQGWTDTLPDLPTRRL
ncbi:CU044_5270 family protein [Actinomadura graeca]|uniref:CU044_5270 family protein n=1 Tax=Actinomadura graeca TaxID=2750812 RepID=A0ABX8R280_9ACTN|nr:CU044_5270 family protein [Actinomadura graeca]QXJ23802.1 CU044_5270 family protein [Actinomadura graeca]